MNDTTQVMTLDELKQGLADRRLYVVAERIGISYMTLKKLYDGVDKDYRLSTLKAVTAYLRG